MVPKVKGHSSPSANDKDSLEAVTSALKANEEAFKGQLPESLRGAGEDIALVVDEDDQCEQTALRMLSLRRLEPS